MLASAYCFNLFLPALLLSCSNTSFVAKNHGSVASFAQPSISLKFLTWGCDCLTKGAKGDKEGDAGSWVKCNLEKKLQQKNQTRSLLANDSLALSPWHQSILYLSQRQDVQPALISVKKLPHLIHGCNCKPNFSEADTMTLSDYHVPLQVVELPKHPGRLSLIHHKPSCFKAKLPCPLHHSWIPTVLMQELWSGRYLPKRNRECLQNEIQDDPIKMEYSISLFLMFSAFLCLSIQILQLNTPRILDLHDLVVMDKGLCLFCSLDGHGWIWRVCLQEALWSTEPRRFKRLSHHEPSIFPSLWRLQMSILLPPTSEIHEFLGSITDRRDTSFTFMHIVHM